MRERYYSLTDVCTKLAIKPHVLRYWEKAFGLTAKRNSAGRRIYSSAQIERLDLIRHLVRDEKLTIKGTQHRLQRAQAGFASTAASRDLRPDLHQLRSELASIKALLQIQH